MYGENKNVIVKYKGSIYDKEMSWAIDGKRVVTECPLAGSSRDWMLLQETSANQQ